MRARTRCIAFPIMAAAAGAARLGIDISMASLVTVPTRSVASPGGDSSEQHPRVVCLSQIPGLCAAFAASGLDPDREGGIVWASPATVSDEAITTAEVCDVLLCRRPRPPSFISSARSPRSHSQVLIGEPTTLAPLLPRARRLRWLQSTFVGNDALLRVSPRRDYVATRIAGDVFGP